MTDLVSKCVLRVEVNETDDSSAQGAEALDSTTKCNKHRGQRPVRDISVETYASRLETPRDDWGLLPPHSRETTPLEDGDSYEKKNEIGFFSGNPFVEITKGILHLYKEDILTSSEEALTLCLLGVPTTMTCHDLLAFTAPCHADIAHIRVLRDSSPNQYMALLTFRTHAASREFYETFNGIPFNSLEPELLCRAVWVSRVEWANDGFPPPGHTELPTCPVCLERMDESVDGVLTILCNHAFHASCLEQWSDSTCPVCRCVQSPEQAESSECEGCGKLGPSTDALWICLICGHVGCGRYQGGHAALHYRESGHCYALQLGSHRVWDYKGDNFVHRLLQNKGDGKLVPTEGPPSESECTQEKVDSFQLEFTYLLTSQLEEQREYFEDKLQQLGSQAHEESKGLREKVNMLSEENKQLKEQLVNAKREKQASDRKISLLQTKATTTLQELNEERQLGKALRQNQQQLQNKISAVEEKYNNLKASSEQEINELKENIRDIMFHIEAQQVLDKVENKEEIASGTITVGDSAENKTKKRNRRRR